ncbi:hypothetical protein [Candidatus Methylomicrobium oryzae]|jgi:hypothetical protein|uniref:hypothetical protein n=1 Tax=Candidatus Methylomicrobium oryzae TaxID=2802053 RepID=UPI00192233B5|nr:hypothetical protein [Methylomicrobium sp. RS1]MBL1265889.1 hypothetical protein [Methylomicrobium sp. RS1]
MLLRSSEGAYRESDPYGSTLYAAYPRFPAVADFANSIAVARLRFRGLNCALA